MIHIVDTTPNKDLEGKLYTLTTELKVGPEFIDRYGHVNYKRIPDLLEPAQDAYMASCWLSFDEIERQYGIRSVVRHYEVDQKQQLFEGDILRVKTGIGHLGNTSFAFDQSVEKNGEPAVQFLMVVVCIDEKGDKVLIPDEMKQALVTISPDLTSDEQPELS